MAEKTSVPEPNSEINKLVYVIRDDGSYRGWRTELLVEKITSKMEEKFLLCNYCGGMLRDASLFEKNGKQELRCSVCIPTDVNTHKVQLNRETVNEKQVYCPLKSKGCDWTNEVSRLLYHLEHCELFSVACPYSQYGCEVKVLKRNLEEHEKEDMHKHMKLTISIISNMQCKVSEQKKENEQLRTKIVQLEKNDEELKKSYLELKSPLTAISTFLLRGNIGWNIIGVKDKISQNNDTYSDPFYVGLYKFQGWVGWVRHDNHIGFYLSIMKGEWDDTLKWPILYKYSMVLINQLDDKHNYKFNDEITEEDFKEFSECFSKPSTEGNNGFGSVNFISHADLLQKKYSNGDRITLKISVELI